MDPEIARKRRERSKQRALKAQMLLSSKPEAKHLFNDSEVKNNELQNDTDKNFPNINQQTASAELSQSIQVVDNQNNGTEKQFPNSQIENTSKDIKEKGDNNEKNDRNEKEDNKEREDSKEIKDNNNEERGKENEDSIEKEEIKFNDDTKENDKITNKNENENNNISNLKLQTKVEDDKSLSSENHCYAQTQLKKQESEVELIPNEEKSKKFISEIFSIRSIPFIIAPFLSYFSVPYGFLILLFMDIVLFLLSSGDIVEQFENDFFSFIKHIYNYVQQFSLKVTCLECIIIVTRILISLPSIGKS